MNQSQELLTYLEEANTRLTRMKQMVFASRCQAQQADDERRRFQRLHAELQNEFQKKQDALEHAMWERDDLKSKLRRVRDRVSNIENSYSANTEALRSSKLNVQREHEDALDKETQRHTAAHRRLNTQRDAVRKETERLRREEASVNHEREALKCRVEEEERRLRDLRDASEGNIRTMTSSVEQKRQEAAVAKAGADTLARRFGDSLDRMAVSLGSVKTVADGATGRIAALLASVEALSMSIRGVTADVETTRSSSAMAASEGNVEVQQLSEEVARLLSLAADLEQRKRVEETRNRELRRKLLELEADLNAADDARRSAATRATGAQSLDLEEAEAEHSRVLEERRRLESELDHAKGQIADLERALADTKERKAQIDHDRQILAQTAESELAQRVEHRRALQQRLATVADTATLDLVKTREEELAELNEQIRSLRAQRDSTGTQRRDAIAQMKEQIRELSVERKELSVQVERMKSLTQAVRMQYGQ
ncbi:hypothetical protein J8273_4753 [Carpediemonas membranifera]|uniref:Uncharacterized protein n=1 Tax=Carpediemonas membranifera TaxID=201153 RepID=A0A8J6B430_9EUKA|nr:hypothetical protein J8273_4753 [Carpediemonas membranifera]|eukprot:KAG9393889.1 hypothetical protein J8273_4753 [Carpediemonas membranifera]